MQCPQCKNENPDRAKFCFDCGAKLVRACPQCGTELPPQAKFCFECGARMEGAIDAVRLPDLPPPEGVQEIEGTPPPPPSMPQKPFPRAEGMAERLQRLVPKEFAERLVAAQGKVQGERRIVTILFSDVKGSTAMAEDLDPEDVMEIMDGAFDILIEPIYRHEGTLARLMGDAVLAFFGAPIAHEDDPERACRAALEIIEGARRYAARLEEEQGIRGFNVRVGINTGLVVVGEVGSDLRAEYTAMGDAVNLAARMEQAAPAGGVMISHNTYRHVRGLFQVQTLDPIAVKGKREPVQVYLIEQAKPRVFRLRTQGVEGIKTRMIARDAELEFLQEALRHAVENCERQMVTVTGEAGVGKSRLLYEFENWMEVLPEHFTVLRGRASQHRQTEPYALIRDLVAVHCQIQDSDPTEVVREKMEQGIGGALIPTADDGVEPAVRAHFIGQLLGFDFTASPYLQDVLSDAKQLRDRALIYLSDFLGAVAEQAPAALHLEDVHWADGSSLDVINQLAMTVSRQRLLIVFVARPALFERRPAWGYGQPHHRRLELQPLSRQESRRLVEEILQKVKDVPAALRQLVVDRAEGNPLYVEELIKMLIEDGVIVKGEDDSPWRVELSRLATARVPPTLVGVLQSRLDRLPLDQRATLQCAAVVGRTFWDDVVEQIALATDEGTGDGGEEPQPSNQVAGSLTALSAKEIIFRQDTSAFAGTSEFAFKHAALRDVTYENMLKRIRRGYHVLVAEWLIEHSGRRATEHAGLIAEHLLLAQRAERALSYMRLAGEQAASRYAHGEAVDYFSRALDLLDQLSLEPGQVQQERYALLLGREAVFRLLGERDAQAADLADLKILAEEMDEMGKRAEVALLHAAYNRAVSDFDTALATAQDAVRWAERASDPHLTCQGFVSWGLTLWQQGRFEDSRTHLEEALALAQRHENQSCEASTLHNLGTVQYFLGDFEGARDYCRQAQAIRRALGDRRGEALSLNNLVAIYDGLGDLAEGKVCGAEALAIYQLIGDRPSEAHALDNLGQNSHALGDLETACEHYQQALAVRRAVGDRGGEAGTLENLGLALHDLGDHEQARQHCEQALAIEREVGDRRGEGYSLTYLALALEGLGDLQAAAAAYQEALHLRQEIGQEALAIDDVAGLAGLALKRGQIAAAQALAEEALVWIEEHGVQGIDYPVRVYLTCADVLTATGQADGASGILAAARALVEERAARISDEDTRRSFREKVPLHARLWQMDSQQTPAFPTL